MDPLAILAVVTKGIGVIDMLAKSGSSIVSAVKAVKNLTSKDPKTVTQEDLDSTEATLDAMLDDFNEPLAKPEGA